MKTTKTWLLGALWAAGTALGATAGAARAGTLDTIRKDQAIRLAYRQDAPPFSYSNSLGEPAGFIVDLCKAVAEKLRQQLDLSTLRVAYVPVTAVDRFAAVEQGRADLLCEPTSATLSRRADVDFSIATFVDGAGLLVRADGPVDPHKPKALAGQKVGVLAGTTTQDELQAALHDAGITAQVSLAKTHADGLAMLESGRVSAYFADREILRYLVKDSKHPELLKLTDNYLTLEPYALALPHGDDDFRLAVDRALSHIYRSGEVTQIFTHAFGAAAKPSDTLQTLYLISGLPD